LPPLSSKVDNVTGYEIKVYAPNGEEVSYEGDSFIPDREGTYTITYTAKNGSAKVAEKSTLVTVLPQEAPKLTIKQNLDNTVWQYGKTYQLPSVLAVDNLTKDPYCEMKVFDSQGKEAKVSGGKITPTTGGFYTIQYTAWDDLGNKGETTARIYCTEETEISAFETPQLMSMFTMTDDNKNVVTWELSHNTDKAYTYANSEGSLKAHFDVAAKESWPGVNLMGSSFAHANLFDSEYDGIRFKFYLEGNISPRQDIWVFVYSDGDAASSNYVEARFNLNNTSEFGLNRWLEFSLFKEELAMKMNTNTGVSFDGKSIYRIRIWTVLEEEGDYLNMYLDNFEYFNE